MKEKQPTKPRFIVLYADGKIDHFNHVMLLQAQKAAHKKAADRKTIVISVTPVTD
jgi:hypothetical protein